MACRVMKKKYIHFLVLLLLSVFFLNTKIKAETANAVVFAENIVNNLPALLLHPLENVPEGKKYKIIEVLNGEIQSAEINLPQANFFASNSDTLLVFLSEDLLKNAELNRLRFQKKLPQIKTRQGQIIKYSEIKNSQYRKFISLSGGNAEANIKSLEEIKSQIRNSFDQAAYEALLWRFLMQKWESTANNEGTLEAFEYAHHDFSNELQMAFSRYLLNNPNPELIPNIESRINTAAPYQKAFYLALLTSWGDSLSLNLSYQVLASLLENNIALDKSYSSGIVEKLQLHNLDLVAIEYKKQLSTVITDKLLAEEFVPGLNNLNDLLNYSLLLDSGSAKDVLTLVAAILIEDLGRLGRQEVRQLEKSFVAISRKIGDDALAPLSAIMQSAQLRKKGFSAVVFESLAAINSEASADSLINFIGRGIHQRKGLIKLAEMQNPNAVEFAWNWVKSDIDSLIAEGQNANRNAISIIKSGGAINQLAKRHEEIPEIEDLLIQFYYETSPGLKQYAYDILIKLGTDSASTIVLENVEYIDEKSFPVRLRFFRDFPSHLKVPFMLEVLKDNVQLPAWEKRKTMYKSSALEEIVEDTSKYCLEAFEYLAMNHHGDEAHVAVSELIERSTAINIRVLAYGAFGPHWPWRAESVSLVFNDAELSQKLKSKISKAGARLLKKRKKEYTVNQLRLMAQVLTERVNPADAKPILKVLSKRKDKRVRAWAEYGLLRIKERI